MKNKKILFLLLILCLFTTCLLFATAEEEANIKDTPPEPKLVLQENNENIELNKEKFEFQTEVSRLMKLIINSLYKTREIFLRELISNASDAIDKIRFLALTQPDALSANPTLNISIWADKENKILTIADSGIGMTKKQLIENLGTIARSGTSEFLDALEDKKADVSLIGQFGVGFYSVFLVADRVTVITKNNDDKQYIWESNAISDFTIAEDPNGNTLGRGTQIRLHLKDDALEFLEDGVLRGVILRYSEFINFPIWLWTTKTETVEVDDNSDDDDGDDDKKNEEPDVDSDEEPKKDKPKKKTKVETVEIPGWELMNTQKPIWTRDPKNVTEIEYENFYSSFAKDPSPPLAWNHFKAEGEIEFRAIIYIPSKAPSDLFQKVQDFTRNVKLFVKRVFITDEFLDFVPKYLQFIRAIIDAEDLPLNVSRETLQQHRALRLIKKRIVKKTFELLASLSKDDEKYKALLKEFGISLKVGAIEDNDNRKKIAQLLKFPSSYNEQNWTTLDAYIGRMKKGQDKMYFITGSSIEEASQSPFVEGLVARGYEVLYMVEPIDEMLVQHMPGHGGKVFLNIAKGDFDFGNSEDKEEASNLRTKFSKLTSWMLSVLSQSVEKVEVSKRLTTSPCAVVASEWGWTGHMEQIMKAQAIKQDQNPLLKDFYEKQKRILEINPNHPLILGLLDQVENDSVNDNTKEMVSLLYETTLIRSGYSIRDNLKYASMVEKMLRTNLGIDLNSKPEINIEPAQDKDEEEVESSKKDEDLFKELEDDYIDDNEKIAHEEL